MDLAVLIYQLACKLPPCESYRLVAQMTRAAASVPANVAEGNARATRRDYANFLAIAKGSLMETETFVMLAVRLEYVSQEEAGAYWFSLPKSAKCSLPFAAVCCPASTEVATCNL